MQPTTSNVIVLKALRVAAGALGQTKPLEVVEPCRFPNAGGNLKSVADYEEIGKTAEESGRKLLQIFGKK